MFDGGTCGSGMLNLMRECSSLALSTTICADRQSQEVKLFEQMLFVQLFVSLVLNTVSVRHVAKQLLANYRGYDGRCQAAQKILPGTFRLTFPKQLM